MKLKKMLSGLSMALVLIMLAAVPALAVDTCTHQWENSGDCTATCTQAGYQPQTCSICGSTREKPVSATGHSWGDSGTSTATCTESGYQPQTCSVCGSTRQKPVSALGHKPAAAVRENEVAATETEDGSYDSVVYCSVCDTEISRKTVIIPATGPVACEHENTEIQNATEATCTEEGYTGDTVCTDCGETVKTGTTIPATGHTETILPAVEADCMHPGLTEGKECSVCGEILVAQKDLGLGDHVMQDGKCVVCGYQNTESSTAELDNVPKTGDSTNVVFYSAAILVSLLGISGLLFKRKFIR